MMKNEKKPHGVKLLIRAVVRDPDGKVIQDTGEKAARSFLIQFLEFIYFMAYGPALGNATSIGGAEENFYYETGRPDQHLVLVAAVAAVDRGIVVGTGDTAETNTDYKLATQLGEGAGAGQITHGAQIIGIVGEVGANVDLETKRSFTNNTGSTITVKEAGIYVRNTGKNTTHCIVRDVLPASVDVPDKCSITVFYTLRTTV